MDQFIPASFFQQTLSYIVVREGKLLSSVRSSVDSLKQELQSMRSYLNDAQRRGERENNSTESMEEWVKQLREAAYDAEDIMDEFVLLYRSPNVSESLLSKRGMLLLLRWPKLRGLVSRMEEVQESIASISQRRTRYNWQRHTPEVGVAEQSICSSGTSIIGGGSMERERVFQAMFDAKASYALGFDRDIKSLVSWLVTTDQDGAAGLATTLLVGMGGLGKTVLAMKVYEHKLVTSKFQCRAWASVSRSFSREDVLKDLLVSSYRSCNESLPECLVQERDRTVLGEALGEYLRKKQHFLVVLDDVWTADVLNSISFALPRGGDGSNCRGKIMVTSRTSTVCSAIENATETSTRVHRLAPLPYEKSMRLFRNKAFRDDKRRVCPSALVETCESLVDWCDGVPLALVTLGGVMAARPQTHIEWTRVLEGMSSELRDNRDLNAVKNILKLSYDELPQDLKSCILYCAVFPKNHLIKGNKLIRLWVCEGFVEQRYDKTSEEVGSQHLKELINRNLLMVERKDEKGKVKLCRVPDLLRELLVAMSISQGFSKIISQNEGCQTMEVRARCLSIHGGNGGVTARGDSTASMGTNPVTYTRAHAKRIRSLFVFSTTLSVSGMVKDFILVRVLDLEGVFIGVLPDEMGNLFHLRYLNLRGTSIKMLPSSFKRLRNLQALDLRDNQVESVEDSVCRMKNLRYVSAYSHVGTQSVTKISELSACKFPASICSFVNLQKLCGISASVEIVERIGNLTQLRSLGILKVKSEHGEKLCSSISGMRKLLTLGITSISEQEPLRLGSLVDPPPFLEDLWLFGRLEDFPSWIGLLPNLAKLGLYFSKMTPETDFIDSLRSSPNLVWFKLSDAYRGKVLRCPTNSFPKLKTLIIQNLPNLCSVVLDQGTLRCLRTWYIWDCPDMKRVPEIDRLQNLKHLHFKDMPNYTIRNTRSKKYAADTAGTSSHLFRATDSKSFYKGLWTIDV